MVKARVKYISDILRMTIQPCITIASLVYMLAEHIRVANNFIILLLICPSVHAVEPTFNDNTSVDTVAKIFPEQSVVNEPFYTNL